MSSQKRGSAFTDLYAKKKKNQKCKTNKFILAVKHKTGISISGALAGPNHIQMVGTFAYKINKIKNKILNVYMPLCVYLHMYMFIV